MASTFLLVHTFSQTAQGSERAIAVTSMYISNLLIPYEFIFFFLIGDLIGELCSVLKQLRFIGTIFAFICSVTSYTRNAPCLYLINLRVQFSVTLLMV
jgi:hypothetical protein